MAGSTNINEVTDALVRLLEANVSRLLDGTVVTVSKLPPEKAEESSDTRLNLHLYHAAHDADGGPDIALHASGARPIATRPMPLKLFYVVTAHSVVDVVEDIAGQQMLMGWAMKTFHDFPVIDASLTVSGVQILPTLEERTIEIILRPIAPEEAISFWSTDQVRTARLSAYYEVRTVLLPPELPTEGSGVVVDFALGVRLGLRPTLGSSESVRRFALAPALGGATMAARVSPAVVALKAGAADADMRMTVFGGSLGDGSDAALVLRGETLPDGAAILDLAANPSWQVLVAARLSITVRPQANARTASGTQSVAILPGFYTLALRRRQPPRTQSGMERPSESESNRSPFAVAPTVASTALDVANHVIVTIDPAYDAQDSRAEPQLSIGGEVYRRVETFAGDPSDIGAFRARSATAYEAVPLFDATIRPRTYPVRLSVNGVDAQPVWMEVA